MGTSPTDRGTGINACPSRITISGVLGNPSLNGVYNTSSCPDSKTIIVATPGVPNWSYPNSTMPEPVIGLTSGTVTSISGYSDLGGADSAVTLGLWETAPNQDMSKRANVIAGTLLHEIGHTLGLTHGGLYYDTPGSYVPTFGGNCKPNYQSVMNYLFQLDGVGPDASIAYSNQTLQTLTEASLGGVTSLADGSGKGATFATSAWYTSTAPSSTTSPATLHCDGTPLDGAIGYRVDGSIAPITPQWSSGQDVTFDGVPTTTMRGYDDWANVDLRQVGATGGEFASLASVLSFGSSESPLQIAPGGSVSVGAGGTVALGSGGTVTLGSGGNVTLGSGGTIALGSGGSVTLNQGGNVTLGSGGTIALGSGGTVTLGSGGNVTLGIGGTITLGSGGTVTLGSGGTITLGSGGTIALGSGGTVTIPSSGGSYTLPDSGGTITLGSGGNVTLGSGGNVTLGSGGVIAMGSGGNITLGSGGNVTLGSGGTITLGSGGTIALGSGGNVTLGSGGTITLGSGGTVTLGSGGNVTLGSGGTVTLGSGGNVSVGSGGNITLGSGGTVTLGSGGTVTLGSGGNVTLGSGGTIALGSGGTVTLGSGGTVTLGSGGTITLGSGGTVTLGAGGTYTIPSGGGTITLGSGGTVTLGSGGNVTLGSGGTITMGSGGTVTLGSGGNVTLGSGGVIALGSGGNVTLGSGGVIALGSGGNVTLGSGGAATTELDYDTANSIVRPPTSPTETPLTTPAGTTVRVDWDPPPFGVVATYTISRSSDGGPAIVIGSVSGVNGNPPATSFLDTNPDLTAKTVIYTISTTLVPDPDTSSQRQSAPSPPAVLTNDQSIVLGSLPSSATINSSPLTVTATAETNGAANGLQVNFSAAGSCSIGSQSLDTPTGVSSASVNLNSTGGCTLTASQPGYIPSQAGVTGYNAAAPVSASVTILPQGSTTQSQTINFGPLPNVQYGATFSLNASSSSGLGVGFTASGPCTTSGTTTGVGLCTITASAPANSSYSAATVSQSFTVFPAVLTVTANNLTSIYGQPLPTLTSSYSGFVNGDSAAVVSGAPALTTTAKVGSPAGSYPITVATGSLAATNYSFRYVNGTLTIQPAGLIITAGDATMTYGGHAPPVTPSFQAFVNGDTVNSLSTPPICGAGVTSLSPVGKYATSCKGATDANYTISYAPGTLTILPASTSTSAVSSTGGTSNYGQLVTFTPTVTGPPVPPGADSVLYSYTNSSINSGVAVSLGSVPLSQGYSTFVLPPGTNTITVTYNGDRSDPNFLPSSATVTQVVAAAPVAYFSPGSVTFPNTSVGTTSAGIPVILTNIGTAPLNITGIHVVSDDASAADFIVQSSTCGSTLPPGPPQVNPGSNAPPAPPLPPGSAATVAAANSCTMTLAFAPRKQDQIGPRTGTLVITSNDGGQISATDDVALTGAALSAISAKFPMPGTPTIAAGNYLWFNSELSVDGPSDRRDAKLKTGSNTIQIMITNGSIAFNDPATDAPTIIPVPDALIQLVPGLAQASTSFDAANHRWITRVPLGNPGTGNIFAAGVPYLVPAAITQAQTGEKDSPEHQNNVTWSAEFTTDTPGMRLNWHWGAAVYNSCFGIQPASSSASCAGNAPNLANLGVPSVNSAGPGQPAQSNGYDAGTPYNFIANWISDQPQSHAGGPPDRYTGAPSPAADLLPGVTPVGFSPSPLVFMPATAGQSGSPMTLTLTNSNQSLPFSISGVLLTGSNAGDFAITATTCQTVSSSGGAAPATFTAGSLGSFTLGPASSGSNSCTVTIGFTPRDLGARTTSLVFTYATTPEMSPDAMPPSQTIDLYGTGAGGANPISVVP